MVRFTKVLGSLSVCWVLAGCAGMIVGSQGWFDRQKPDVQPKASADLACSEQQIKYEPVKMGDYRQVQASGCGKKVEYTYVKIGPAGSWSKAGDVSKL